MQPLPEDETEISASQFKYMTCLGLAEGALSPGRATYTGGLIGGITASADTVELLIWKIFALYADLCCWDSSVVVF